MDSIGRRCSMSKNTPPPHPDLSPYIFAISSRFRPASTPEEATHRFSTKEVKEAIKELNPALDVTDADVFAAMMAAGYRFNTAPGSQSLRFQWLLVEK